MTDGELLRRVQRGDVAAWRSLYGRCFPLVWRQAWVLVRDRTTAEEVAGETMLAFVHALPEMDAEVVHLQAWLRGVVRHKVADHGRQQVKHSRMLASVRSGPMPSADGYAPDAPVEAEEDRQQVLDVLGRLTDVQRTLLEWKHVENLSVADIADRVGQTEKSVESLLYRARREFRRLYERATSASGVNGAAYRQEVGTHKENS